ncbi:MAG: ABC transporter permease subunit [Oscillospiraceae bacterium]|nr:ABC transporter permease subunit [Oscillospiraceae bacterium]
MSDKKRSLLSRIGFTLAAAVFWIAVWQIIYLVVGSSVIVASPLETFLRVLQLAATTNFWLCILNSIGHILLGFLLAVLVSVPLAALTARFELLYRLFSPLLKLVRATPVASFIVLALFWLSREGVPSFIAFLMVVPLVFTNLSEGFRNIDRNLLEMAQVYKFSILKKIRLIYLSSLMPYFVSACSVGLGFAWKSGIAAEVISLPENTLGLEIYNAKVYIETVDLFALTAVIIILSIFIEKSFMFILKRISDNVLKGGAK